MEWSTQSSGLSHMSNVQYKQPCRHDDWTKTVSSRRSSIIVIENENENENIRCGHGVRHMVGNEPKTSMIVLCEDGSLRIYTAKPEKTNYWLPYLTTGLVMGSIAKSLKKKKSKASADPNVTFPVDFFENCQVITDVEFGGSDFCYKFIMRLKSKIDFIRTRLILLRRNRRGSRSRFPITTLTLWLLELG